MKVNINPNRRIQTGVGTVEKASDLLKRIYGTLNKELGADYPELFDEINAFIDYKKEINEPRNVLDHGFVRLVDYMGNDLSIVRAARVSYNAEWRAGEDDNKDEKLIGYLLRNRHYSPFECVVFTFEFKVPIFVARQMHRHWSWRWNEVSARYTELPEEVYIPKPEHVGKQSKDNKQCRDLMEKDMKLTNQDEYKWAEEATELIRDQCVDTFKVYKALLGRGCPREIARLVLPVGTYTRFFGTVNLRSLLHFLDLRLHSHAQWEIRVYADAILDIIRHIVPATTGHWNILRDVKNG